MRAEFFFDTNILIYAYDLDAGRRRDVAFRLVHEALMEPQRAAVSVQVLQEFFVNITRRGQSDEIGAALIDDFSSWHTVNNTRELFLSGLQNRARYQLSLWDAMIVAAAQRAESPVLYTEDLNHGQDYDGVMAVNPFVE